MFTPAERAAMEERQRKMEALLEKMADSTPVESNRIARGFFHELGAARRVQSARQVAQVLRVTPRPRGGGRPAVRGSAQRSSARSGDSGDDGPEEPFRGRRLNSRAEILAWAEERHRTLSALIEAEGLGQEQLSLDERWAA